MAPGKDQAIKGEEMSADFYITTPIYYVNDKPHIGHAYTSIACDVLARFNRMNGHRVMFLTGTDEHGQKVENSAKKHDLDPLQYCDKMSQTFRDLTEILNISNDDFIRTTEPRHKTAVEKMWRTLLENGDIYKGTYKGWYNVSDEAFVPDNEVIDGGFSKDGKKLEFCEESSYFFRLSKWEQPLLAFFEAHPEFVRPRSKFNEVISFVKSGLKDLSISRSSFKWGIPVPGDDSHVIYVWLDALTNYLSAIGYGDNGYDRELWENSIHVIGKDILRFHAVYWVCFLLASGVKPPSTIFAHGWWTNNGQKISKSLGNTIDPIEIVDKYGLDQFRYFILREVPFGSDGDFSESALKRRINADLCNDLGNLIQRVLKLATKNLGTDIRYATECSEIHPEFATKCKTMLESFNKSMKEFAISKALESVFELVSYCNQFVEITKPWSLAKSSHKEFEYVISSLLDSFRLIAFCLSPFMPGTADKIFSMIGAHVKSANDLQENQELYRISNIEILFNKIED